MSAPAKTAKPIVELRGVTKIYGGVNALDDVNFDVRPGEIHAILGENGAGKSTLSKILSGAIRSTSGRYLIDEKEVSFDSPGEALEAGVAMVYQETSLVPSMSVAQNMQLGNEKLVTRYSKIAISAQQALQSLNFDVDPLALIDALGTAKRQMVEIARAVQHNARVIIFDEPTASLTPEEIQYLFHLIKRLRDQNKSIIFISHALEEALQIADRITVLRDGKLVKTAPSADLDRAGIVQLMVGREVAAQEKRIAINSTHERREKILSIENVTMGSMVKNMSFSVYAGEVVGIAGLVGSGRTEVCKIAAGVLKRNFLHGGMIYLRGKPVRYRVPRQAVRDGIVYITEDRKMNGFFETMNVNDNIYLGKLTKAGGFKFLYSAAERKRVADFWVEKLGIAALKRSLKIIEYSGGNQQKVVVAKALAQEPDVIFFDEPTRGVDVGAIPQIHNAIRSLAAEGKAVVVISSYLPEVIAVSDRILVARAGRVVEEFSAEDATKDKILFAAIH